jgi:hypothetical protein
MSLSAATDFQILNQRDVREVRSLGSHVGWLRAARVYTSRATLVAASLLVCFGCGNPHAILEFAAPSAVTAGSPFTVTVTATVNGNRDTIINSRMHFTSSDPGAILPGDYYFSTTDAGSHTFTNGFALITPGKQTISADIFDATGINGSVTVSVLPGHAGL